MKRSFKHWSPAYLFNRLRERLYRRLHPDLPWLSPEAVRILSENLRTSDVGLEFGSGRSTLWFAQRVGFLTSVEHNPEWHRRVSIQARRLGLTNLTCLLVPREGQAAPDPACSLPGGGYARTAERFADGSLDFILVDGIYRDACANASLDKLRAGGLFILDDAQRYLPSESTSPYARSLEEGPASPAWAHFYETVRSWNCQWTSNGVSDTVIFYKPQE
jgi:predicted O-methyltransferase YrrM